MVTITIDKNISPSKLAKAIKNSLGINLTGDQGDDVNGHVTCYGNGITEVVLYEENKQIVKDGGRKINMIATQLSEAEISKIKEIASQLS